MKKVSLKAQPSARVIAQNSVFVTTEPIDGLHPLATAELSGGGTGLVWREGETTDILLLDKIDRSLLVEKVKPLHRQISIPVRTDMLGDIVNPLGVSRISKKAGKVLASQPIFAQAPKFYERAIVDSQLETGVTMIDTLFPVVSGQRIAVLGDAKAGKTTFLTQAAIHRALAGEVIVYVAIAKHKQDIDKVLYRLYKAGAEKNVILVNADVFDPLAQQFLAPYAGAALAEYFWHAGKNVTLILDDLSMHAKIYRELSLLTHANPGREGYPGNMFHTHSALLERAGKLKSGAAQTMLVAATTPNDDITNYISTNLISMCDGQLVFDLETMRKGVKPAVNIALSVSRVGGRSQTPEKQQLSSDVMKNLAAYKNAEEFARFSTKLSENTKRQIEIGSRLYELFVQTPEEFYTLLQQQVMLNVVFMAEEPKELNIGWLKSIIRDVVPNKSTKIEIKKLAKDLIKSNPVAR